MPENKPFGWITGFIDEASADPAEQISTAKALGLQAVDVRGIRGKNVMELSDDEAKAYHDAALAAGLKIQTVSSPINKVVLNNENRASELIKLRRAIQLCRIFETRFIRIFSPEGSDWPAVRDWMADQIKMATDDGIVLLHENDARFYGAFPDGAKQLFEAFGGPNFKAAFDFANTVLIGYRPMNDWFPWLLPHLHTLHIKDARQDGGQILPAGQGDGQMLETFRWLRDLKWDGPLTIEPHLAAAGPMGGFSGIQLFIVAVGALRQLLAEV